MTRPTREKRLRHGFVAGDDGSGRRYVVRDVHRIERADADLWNDRMYLQIDHRGRCDAWFLQPNVTRYSQPLRCVYVRDAAGGELWSCPYDPVQAAPDEFEFSVGPADLRWRVVRGGIEVSLQLVVPRKDTVELWRIGVRNVAGGRRRLHLYSFMPVGSIGPLAHRARYDPGLGGMLYEYFPYYVRWQDYSRLRKLRNAIVCLSAPRPTSYETSLAAFLGGRGLHDPAQLREARLARGEAMMEPAAAVFQFTRTLAPGKGAAVGVLFGPAADAGEARRLRARYLRSGGIAAAAREAEAFLADNAPTVRIRVGDAPFEQYVNVWQPRRAVMLARTLRLTFCPQARNAIQDAQGAVYTSPADARRAFRSIWAHQRADGWLPHGLPLAEGVETMPITTIPHRDTNVWGPLVVPFYVAETGDRDVLDLRIPFADRRGRATLYEHLCVGLEWLLSDRSPRGLSHLGQGDWNDPLNMAGRFGKGESVWLTEALSYALALWADVADRVGDGRRARRYRREAEKGRRALNAHAWDGQWYARGTTDEGRWFGVRGRREGRIFLNAQSWAILCGAARGRRVEAIIRSVNRLLMTPAGPMTLYPPFAQMREEIGKLTQKTPGTGENASVYCHAVTFYAYALYAARRAERAWRLLRNLLTGTRDNPISRSGQLPLYVPNFYRGRPCGRTAGRSSHSPNTGTSAWYYRTVVSMLMGLRAEWDGLRIDPQLPRAWPRAAAWRRWRGAEFDVEIVRRRGCQRRRVLLDGEPLGDNLVPPQRRGSRHRVRVEMPERE